MPTGARRLPEDDRDAAAQAQPAPEPDLAVLALQRSAGNAAVARLLAREPAADAPTRFNVRDPFGVSGGLMADDSAASQAAFTWFDAQAKGGVMVMSIAELVHGASQQSFTRRAGGEAKVADKLKPEALEGMLRDRARHFGITVPEHRGADDLPGMRSEMDAILANLGAIPTEIKLGSDDINVVASISGKVSGEAKLGKVKVEGEVSGEGAEGSVSVGGAKVTGSAKGVKAEMKINGLLKVSGGLQPNADGSVAWNANVEIGTIGKLIMPEDVAKVFKGTQETFAKSAGELARNLDDPAKVKEHGGALAGAVKDAVDKAQKSAAQANKPGWRIGAELKGDGAGGISGGVTLTWVW